MTKEKLERLAQIRELKRFARYQLENGDAQNAARYMRDAKILERELMEHTIQNLNTVVLAVLPAQALEERNGFHSTERVQI